MSKHSSRGKEWDRVRAAVLIRDNHLCQYCLQQGTRTQATHVDHVLAKALGGTDAMDNLVASCAPCNLKKGSKQVIRTTFTNARWF